MAGFKTDSSVNGIYTPAGDHIGSHLNGCPVYANQDSSRLLHWVPDAGGKWIIADAVDSDVPRAIESNLASSTGGTGPALENPEWMTMKKSGWQREKSVTITGVLRS